jgi:hypothetical protein
MTQTAVKFLIDMISYTSRDTYSAMVNSGFLEQAKEMEKKQIIAARQDGYDSTTIDCDSGCSSSFSLDGTNDQYYEQTYGGKP